MNQDLSFAREKPAKRVAARPLIPLTLALALGIAATAWGLRLSGAYLAVGLVGFFAGVVTIWLTGNSAKLMPLVLFGLLGLALARQALHPDFPPQHVARLPQEQEITIKGRLCLPPQVQEGRVRLILEASAWRSPQGWRQASGRVLLTANLPDPVPPEGSELVVRTALRQFRDPLNPGAFQRSRYFASRGIFRDGRLKEPSDLVVLASGEPPALRERLREGLRRLLSPLDPIPRALYLALILGDQGEITQPMRQALSRTGTSHLVAISGLHLGMLAGLSFLVAFWLLRRVPWLLLRINAVKVAAVLAAGPVVAYAWIAGGSPSTQRAEIMILAYLLMVLVGRPREVPSALALAALGILALSPLLLFSLSFQLSFLSVAALIYFLPRWASPPDPETPFLSLGQKWVRRAGFWVKGALLASLVATLATAPLVAASFHVVSVLGIVVNLAAIPLMNGVAVPVGLLALMAEALHLTLLAKALLILGQFPLKLAYGLISQVAALPGAAVILPTPSWLQIILFYACLLLLFPPRRSKATWSGFSLAGLVLAGTVALAFFPGSGTCEITCLDSYAGLDGVIVTPDNRRLVVSAGWPAWPGQGSSSGGPLPSYLHWRQFRRLDEVMALTLTPKNAPEMLKLTQEFNLGEFWFGGGARGEATITLRNLLGDLGRPARSLERARPPLELGQVELNYYGLKGGRGVALEVTCQGRRILFVPPAGELDLEGYQQTAEASPPEALIIPGGTHTEHVRELRPKYVIICGSRSHAKVPGRTSAAQRYFTRHGAVSLYLSAEGVHLSQWRP